MVEFLAGRLLRTAITLWAIATIVFFAIRLTGNPIDFLVPPGVDGAARAAMIHYWGLDEPVMTQYGHYWLSVLHGDFGLGLAERRPVSTMFLERMGRSVSLLVAALLVTAAVGVPVGILAALWRRKVRGTFVLLLALLGYAIPNFVFAIGLLLVFSFTLHWLPSSGASTPLHYVMPTLSLSAFFVAAVVRYTRSSMLDVLSQDFMRTARAKGLPEYAVILQHGLRNALVPVVTVLGLQVTTLVSGAVVVETVFSWNGVGDLLVNAALSRDYPVIQFGVLATALAVIAVNILVDLLCASIDPRTRLKA